MRASGERTSEGGKRRRNEGDSSVTVGEAQGKLEGGVAERQLLAGSHAAEVKNLGEGPGGALRLVRHHVYELGHLRSEC